MVAGRAHERKHRRGRPGGERGFGRRKGGADGAAGVVADAGKEGRVGVEIARLRETLQVGGRVGEEEGRAKSNPDARRAGRRRSG